MNTFNKNMKVMGQEYEVLVVDTAGQDEFSIFPTQYSVDIDGYVLVYSIDNEKSFEIVQVIYEKLIDLIGNPAVPLVLVGNKSDLHVERRITEAMGKKLAQDMKALFIETSAKDNQCAMDLFTKSIIQIEKVIIFIISYWPFFLLFDITQNLNHCIFRLMLKKRRVALFLDLTVSVNLQKLH